MRLGIKEIVLNILGAGYDDTYEYSFGRRVRFVNFMSVTSAFSWFVFGVTLSVVYGIQVTLILGFVAAIVNLYSFFLNRNKYHKAALYVMIISNLILYVFTALLLGRSSGIQYLLLMLIVTFPFYHDSPSKSGPLFTLGLFSYFGIEYIFAHFHPIYEYNIAVVQWVILVVSVYFIKVIIEFFKQDSIVYQKSITSKNQLLEQQKEEISTQNELLEEQNTEIETQNTRINTVFTELTSSVSYASRIQESILLPKNLIDAIFSKCHVFYRPKDIVSGDFYWVKEKGVSKYLAVVDCTGHGVPGAFMTAIGNTLLNEIVEYSVASQPGVILSELHNRLIKTLNFELRSQKVYDGMDMALIQINESSNTLTYSGARRPLYIVQNNELKIVTTNNRPIGGTTEIIDSLKQVTITYSKGDRIYLFSDGYADQFGGPNQKKFKTKYFRKALVDMQNSELGEQFKLIEELFDAWKGSNDQTDDVVLIALEL
ncbi:MAG: SpoIIE family protein phosphatase [Bacteroidales bacterium]|nr:SpoIIE family protein phosphatase [Bacteroidales bacterium]